MPKIEWDDSFSVHNAEIDGQHKKWIEIFNNMHNILMEGYTEVKLNVALEALKAMRDYTSYHYDFEEEYMRTMNYPKLYEHKRLHKNFDNQIYSLIRYTQEGNLVLKTEIIKLSRNWLFEHIIIEDKKYALYFETKN